MAKPAARIAVLQVAAALAVTAVLGRAAQLQLLEGSDYRQQVQTSRLKKEQLPARRGAIYDRNGAPLAITQQFYHIDLAPNEFADTAAAIRLVSAATGERVADLRQMMKAHLYPYLGGPYSASMVQPLRGIRGVHLSPEYMRAYPSRDLAALVVGRVALDTTMRNSGVESTFDSTLAGVPGEAVLLRSPRGQLFDSPSRIVRMPRPGAEVYLTIDAEMQDIAERGLDAAIEENGAEGGDVVMLDPRTGEVLALAARQGRNWTNSSGSATAPSFFTSTFEPGSTAKLFTAAALLLLNRVTPTDAVPGHNGKYDIALPHGRVRTISDEHAKAGTLTLADAIHYSSNVAMAQFAGRLTVAEQFEMIRAFGFGTPTGVEFPSESRGGVRALAHWTREESQPSVAMGYEFAVTPIQLAVAYAAIANGGILLTPAIVREVRDLDGTVRYKHAAEPVRRVLTPEVAATLRDYLKAAVSEGGTGMRANLTNYEVVGKTGTATKVVDGRYDKSKNTASFAAIFPKDNPQLVVVTKIDAPKNHGFGGTVAAPATRQMLEQALSAHDVALDRWKLARGGADRADTAPITSATVSDDGPAPRYVAAWPLPPAPAVPSISVEVPEVHGLDVRAAALKLHRRGFQVSVVGVGHVVASSPAAGATAPSGTLVTIRTD